MQNAPVGVGYREEFLAGTDERARVPFSAPGDRAGRASQPHAPRSRVPRAAPSAQLSVGSAEAAGAAVPVPAGARTCGGGGRSWRTPRCRGWPWPRASSWLCRCCCPRPSCPAESGRSRLRRPKVSAGRPRHPELQGEHERREPCRREGGRGGSPARRSLGGAKRQGPLGPSGQRLDQIPPGLPLQGRAQTSLDALSGCSHPFPSLANSTSHCLPKCCESGGERKSVV